MRRKEREVTEPAEIEAIIKKCKVCRIAMNDAKGIYIVPLNFGYQLADGVITLYFHGAKEGRKADLLNGENVIAGFEMDCDAQLVEGAAACSYTSKYASIIGQGKAAVISDMTEKEAGMNFIMEHQTGKRFEFPEQMLARTMLFKITAEVFSAKRND